MPEGTAAIVQPTSAEPPAGAVSSQAVGSRASLKANKRWAAKEEAKATTEEAKATTEEAKAAKPQAKKRKESEAKREAKALEQEVKQAAGSFNDFRSLQLPLIEEELPYLKGNGSGVVAEVSRRWKEHKAQLATSIAAKRQKTCQSA